MSVNSEKINQIPVNPPEDMDKPFFAYGIFKKGQLSHSKIEDCVDHIEYGKIEDCILKIRDGIPLISREKTKGHVTKGQVIYFLDEQKQEAYYRISDTEPDDLYEWGITTIDGKEMNVLYGKKPDSGSFTYETDNGFYVDSFDGKLDPLFSDLPVFLKRELENLSDDDYDYFRIQMYYMMLWSAIDRYCSLKYDSINYQSDNIRALSNDQVFIDSINECNLPHHSDIFSTKNAKPWEWREHSTYSKLYYYYTVRCNVVHRGKDRLTNIGILRQSLEELLMIFDKVIDKTFE